MQNCSAPVLKPVYWEEAVAYLMRDRILKKLIPRHPEVWLATPKPPFVTLARAVVGQQIATRTADALWARFLGVVGRTPSPGRVKNLTVADLRSAGLPLRKAEYILDLAHAFDTGRVHPQSWAEMDD